MDKDFVKGLKISAGFIFGLVLFFGIVFAAGFHSANEIIGGIFQGNYTFNGSVYADNLESDRLRQYALLSITSNGATFFENGFYDNFENENHINITESINQNYDENGDFYTTIDTSSYGSTLITGGEIYTASEGTAANAADGSTGSIVSLDPSLPTGSEWWQVQFSVPRAISRYSIHWENHVDIPAYCTGTVIYASNDGSNFIEISDDRTGIGSLTQNTLDLYNFTNFNSYTYWRIYSHAGAGGGTGNCGFAEVEMYEYSGANNIDLVSKEFSSNKQVSSTQISIAVEEIDSIVENTDLIAYISIDGGSTWGQVNLVDNGNATSSIRILDGKREFPSSGTNILYNISTFNSKSLKIYGVGMSWN